MNRASRRVKTSARVGLTGLTVAQHFRDAQGQDVILPIFTTFSVSLRLVVVECEFLVVNAIGLFNSCYLNDLFL